MKPRDSREEKWRLSRGLWIMSTVSHTSGQGECFKEGIVNTLHLFREARRTRTV